MGKRAKVQPSLLDDPTPGACLLVAVLLSLPAVIVAVIVAVAAITRS